MSPLFPASGPQTYIWRFVPNTYLLYSFLAVSTLGVVTAFLHPHLQLLFSGLPLFLFIGAGCGGGGGGDCGGPGSTPFLYVWDGERLIMDNDILFGKPTSFFYSREQGKLAYDSGRIKADRYIVRTAPKPRNGTLAFQIREIEAEESFIDHLSFRRVRVPERATLVVDAKFNDERAFETGDLQVHAGAKMLGLEKKTSTEQIECRNLASFDLWEDKSDALFLDRGEHIDFTARIEDRTRQPFLFIGSYYRDWTGARAFVSQRPTRIRSLFQIVSGILHEPSISLGRALYLSMLILTAWALGGWKFAENVSGQPGITAESSAPETLFSYFGVPSAYADVPPVPGAGGNKSLIIEFRDMHSGLYKISDIVEPRYPNPSLVSVAVPDWAISPQDGTVQARVTATKRHALTHISLCAPRQCPLQKTKDLQIEKALHVRTGTDYSAQLRTPYSGDTMHLVAGDVVEISLELPESAESQKDDSLRDEFVVDIGGYYVPLSPEGRRIAGSWYENLDAETRAWLTSLVPFSEYV